ncbi:reverse transcriptase [Phytophthora megakarya]|uniref:Reverse transcriptase n=1 Tax=Phytophthora megakarya TaxID=4795 RepID=A0A225WFR3_9STRA|nr:reverse transcriptase [Phytophthora megakarya]
MVRVPESSGDSGYHRESDQEDAKIKDKPGIGTSTEGGSPSLHLKTMDHENKPHPPPLGPSGPSADRDENRDPPDEAPSVKTEGSSSTTTPPIPRFSAKKKSPSKLGKPKMRAPDAEESGDVRTWTPDQLQKIFYRKQFNAFLLEDPVMIVIKPKLIGELQGPVKPLPQASDLMATITSLMNMFEESGIVAGAFDAVFQLSLTTVEESSKCLFKLLKPLVGAMGSLSSLGPMEEYPTSVSSYSGSTKPVMMTLGPSGAAMLEARKIKPDRMQSFFNTVMDRFLKEQSEEKRREQLKVQEASDVDMESVGSFHPSPDEYDPDDLSIDVPRRVAVASAEAAAPSGGAAMIPRVRMAVISELKEFSGRDTDEDRARSWLGKVKSAFIRDQAPDSENWKDLLDGFRVEYCGLGVSLARQYYHAMKRSDESPLGYLHRLTVLGLRAKLAIKTETAAVLREHVEHFIETLYDRDLADQLTLLRLADGDAWVDVLRYWKYYSPGKWFKQAKITGKINNSKATMLLDFGAEVPIVDTTFARKVGCIIDESQRQECVGIGENVYTTLGRTTIKVTLTGYLVYFFDVWVGALAGQDAIWGMDVMVPAGIHLDFADGTTCLADEVRIQLSGRRPPNGRSRHSLLLEDNAAIPVVADATVRWADPIVTDSKPSEPKVAAEEEITDQGSQVHREGEVHAKPEADLTLDAEATVPTLVEDAPADETPKNRRLKIWRSRWRSNKTLKEIVNTTEEAKIEDVQAGDPKWNTPEEINRLRRIIWRRNHLLIWKGNALPAAAVGVVCDIDVGGATPIAQRVRRVAPQYREKLSDLIKGLLSAKIIVPCTSPWDSPIVIIVKKNWVDIRLCIDYRLVNSLTRLMVYPMPLINDLLEDLYKVFGYCSLDMASGFWVVQMTKRARRTSAFITPFGLFEWTRMPFGLKNAPQIYQRLLDNALYGFLKIGNGEDAGN